MVNNEKRVLKNWLRYRLKCHQIRWAMAIDQSKAIIFPDLYLWREIHVTRIVISPNPVSRYLFKALTWSKLLCTGPYIATSGDDALKFDGLRVLSCDTHHWQITGSLVMSIVSWKLCPIGYMNHEIVLLATCKLIVANMSHCFSSVPLSLRLLPAREQVHVH